MKECTRCGNCCKSIPCGIGMSIFGDIRPCPGLLIHSDETTSCDVILHPSKYVDIGGNSEERNDAVSKFIKFYNGVGYGCCNNPFNEKVKDLIKKSFNNFSDYGD